MARMILLFVIAMAMSLPARATSPGVCLPAEQLRLSARIVSTQALDVTVENTALITSTAATLAVWAVSALSGETVYSDTVNVPALEPGASMTFRAEVGVYLPAGQVRAWWQWQAANCPSRYVTYWRGWLPVLRESALQASQSGAAPSGADTAEPEVR